MNESTIQPELVSLHAKLAGEIERDEKQAELLSKRIQKNKELLHAVNGSLGMLVAQATGYGALSDNIRAAITSIPADRFTAIDVERAFRTSFPTAPLNKTNFRTALWNLTKKGEINCVRKGNNRLPAEYEKVSSAVGRKKFRRGPDALLPMNGEQSG